MKDSQTILTPPPEYEERTKSAKGSNKDAGQKVYAFDKSYWSFDRSDTHYAGQDDLHNDLGKPLLINAFQGYNNCIFAYGQTGSGKSYSMMGYGKEAGVIPQICQDMFVRIKEMQQDKDLRCTVEVSYLEIYNERVRDLLNPSTKGNLKVREHPSTGPYVEDLAKLVVSSFNEIEHLMDEGNKARTVAATNMNETSSRSHAVFTLTLTQKRQDTKTNMAMEKVAKISLVDLAGSERATSTGATGARLKEGAEINRSLSTLGRVIAALADLSDGKKKKGGKSIAQVPYRDSVLTWLLKDSLGGNSMTAMIAAISPADINFDETLSTLRYADSAKRIKNHAVVNEDANARMIRELKEELEALRGKLSGGAGGSSEEKYAENTPLDQQIVSITQADGTVKKVSKAEIAEQLSQSEKLYSDLNQTWEQKLAKTEEIHKEREAALEELGISIEKGFVGLHTPKKMPHLVNLSDDPLLAECLVYNLKPGTTTVGNVDTNTGQTSEIRLNGSRILHEHCTFENLDNIVTLVPKEGAAVMVNGKRIMEPKRLRSGYRVILGDFHIFRFNHPMEARAERAEQSSLRHSIIANQIGDYDKITSSPALTPKSGHERSMSRAFSEAEWDGNFPESPLPQRGRDSDWSFARREAAGAILGPDKHIAGLTDEELNLLFEDVQRARAERAVQNLDDDMESDTSYPVREKYMSTGTSDNYSLDTALTTPSTPKQGDIEDRMREVREEMQSQLNKQKEEYQDHLNLTETPNLGFEEFRREKDHIEESLQAIKADVLERLDRKRIEFQDRIHKLDPSRSSFEEGAPLSEGDRIIARKVAKRWLRRRYVKMAENVLHFTADLKEAQILSQEMEEDIYFQFIIIEAGHNLSSSYDVVLNSIPAEEYDPYLEYTPKPCVGVRVINYRNSNVYLWSLEKLRNRVRLMRQMHQNIGKYEDPRSVGLDNPFIEKHMPQFTHIGDADVPLSAVYQSRVQDLTLDVISPYTSHSIGIIKLSLEPSLATASPGTLKFNVVMHDLVGFAEREGTDVHAQLFLPGFSESGVTTTQMIKEFDEGPIRFESVHSQSLPMFDSPDLCFRVAIFARVSSMHLDKLLSWDDMQDNGVKLKTKKRDNPRIPESQFIREEKHEVFAKIQILELAENGQYCPVKVIQTSKTDSGSFQLHQGVQRRIMVELIHSSGDAFSWQDASDIQVGDIQLVNPTGKLCNAKVSSPTISLKPVSSPIIIQNADGTGIASLTGQWDSSAHSSLLLDRVTEENSRIKISISWKATSSKLSRPMSFIMDIFLIILPRSNTRTTSILASLFQNLRIVHSSSGIFSVSIHSTPVKKAGDLWRVSTQDHYVKGEENLINWKPRGVSLVRDHVSNKRKKYCLTELEALKPILSNIQFANLSSVLVTRAASDPKSSAMHGENDGSSSMEKTLLEKYIKLWKLCVDPAFSLLASSNTEPPTYGIFTPPPTSNSPLLLASITRLPKSRTVLKSGFLLMLSADTSSWVRRFVELRFPFLHLYSVPDAEEVGIVSLRKSRIDHSPPIAKLVWQDNEKKGVRRKKENYFAIYGTDNTWLFMARNEREKIDWIWRIDKSYIGSNSRQEADDRIS
ncbi:Kinesin-like protein [Podosphaera aphanis]|nr:Kinesin-like protein [Podosphaera aphanis]